jgi:hypothetical protein
MNDVIKNPDVIKILKALDRIKKGNLEPNTQATLSNTEYLLENIKTSHSEKNLDEQQLIVLAQNLNFLKIDLFEGNEDIIASINNVIEVVKDLAKKYF